MAGVDLAECELRWSDPPAPVCQAATAPKARVRARRAGFGGRLAEASPDLTLPSPVRPRGRRGEISVGRAVGRSAHALARKRVQGAASTGAARAL